MKTVSSQLNESCFCVTLDRTSLGQALECEAGDRAFAEKFLGARPHLFSNVPVFLSASALAEMEGCVAAVEEMSRLPAYQAAVLSWAPEIAQANHGPVGALMGYDFHLGGNGPSLIEVNTNAGGAFLNALLVRAQRRCCVEMAPASAPMDHGFEDAAFQMFQNEWKLQRGTDNLTSIAIVDDSPADQYLYPELVLARKMLSERGVDTIIADAAHLRFDGRRLWCNDLAIDLVYNRVTDFAFDRPEHRALKDAYRNGAVVVTPSPHNHALLADKRNLSVLSDPEILQAWGVDPGLLGQLDAIPGTIVVTTNNIEALWKARKNLFFKPSGGHGGKAVYRGDKLTKGVWAAISQSDYVAQTYIRPSQRMIRVDDVPQARKMDVRLYTYDGKVLLVAARLYQGQTTNFKTPGGGFAPVFVV